MAKTTPIDSQKANRRLAAVKALKKRPMTDEKSVAKLRERLVLIEAILGIE